MTLTKNFWTGLFLAGIGLFLVFVLIPNGIVEPRKVKYVALSPSYYPRIVSIVLILLGGAIAIRGFLERSVAPVNDDGVRPDATWRIVAVFALLIAYALLIETLGFVLLSVLALAAFTFLAGERRLWLIATSSILLPFVLYFFFVKVANIPIPSGILEPLLVGS